METSTDPIWNHITNIVAWLNSTNQVTDHEIAMRIMKLSEEVGEVVMAYIGMVGQNPRKGTSHSLQNVKEELCDVIITGMVALATIDPSARDTFQHYVLARAQRLQLLLDQP